MIGRPAVDGRRSAVAEDHASSDSRDLTPQPAVVLHNLEKRFGDFVAVNRVSLEVRKGEIFGFLGPNGAGKSTTIRMLCGIIAPTSGEGRVAGFDISTQPEQIKSHIGYMSQRFSLYDDLKVEENLDFYAGIYGIPLEKRAERKQRVLEMAGLVDQRGDFTRSLPVGWKQRLALGCAVLHEPPILFLDEPTSGVDPISRRRFWELIYDLSSRGVTVFVTTHYMEEAEYCERLGMIYRGELIAEGTPEELKTKLMHGHVLEITAAPPQEAMAAVAEVAGVSETALFGTTVHALVMQDAAAIAPAIERRLDAGGFAHAQVRQIKPSLEDVFVALVRERDGRTAPVAEVRG